MESWTVAQRATEIAQRPVRLKRNRRRTAKHALAEAVETGLETLSDADHFAFEGAVDESRFARMTADLVTRGRDARPFGLPSSSAEASKADLHESSFLGSTAGLFVYKGEATGTAIKAPPTDASDAAAALAAGDQADAELHRLRAELDALRSTLAERETALANADLDHERAEMLATAEAARAQVEGELRSLHDEMDALRSTPAERETALASADLDHERAEMLATAEAARARVEGELRSLRDEMDALRSTLAERETALAQAAFEHETARKSWQHASQIDEHEWKAAESTRLAEAEAKWQEQSAKVLADVGAEAEAAREHTEQVLRSLRDEMDALRSTLAEREAALVQAALEHETARKGWLHASQTDEHEWKAAESTRLAEAEAKWQERSARALSEAHAEAAAARTQADGNIRSLQDQLAALQEILADRETALAKAVLDHEQARASWREESEAASSKAEQARKLSEAARLAEAEAKWQEQSARALTAAHAETAAARTQADGNIRSLQDQLAALQATLADRETALANAASDTEHVRERGRQEVEEALAKAKAREADEAARLAAAQTEWRKQSANALSEATARYQTAEGMLTEIRMQSDRARSGAVGGSSRSASRTSFGPKPTAREPEAAAIRLPTREERGSGTQDPLVVLRPKHVMAASESPPRKRRTFRDIVVVASLAIAVIVSYPSVEPLLPENLRSNIAAIIGEYAPSPNFTVQGFASVVSDVNLRAGPSTTARVIATLPSGLKVATVGRRGEWTFVEIADDRRNSQPRRGWVFGSFLKDETADVEDDVETASPEDAE